MGNAVIPFRIALTTSNRMGLDPEEQSERPSQGVEPVVPDLLGHFGPQDEIPGDVPGRAEAQKGSDGYAEFKVGILPREHDHLLFQVGDEAACGFMAAMVRELGGAVALHDWGLAELAGAAYPVLGRGGVRGAMRAVREGGLEQARCLSRLRAGAPGEPPPLNRSVVRFADGFFVATPDDRERILAERNAPTPIVVVDPEDAARAAELYVEALESFPRPRSVNKRLLWRRIRGELARGRGS